MFCTHCGYRLQDADRFCARCGSGTEPEPEPAPAAPRRLTRPVARKKIAGVCAGLAAYLGVDATLIRLLWIAATILSGGAAILAYIGAWIAMPREYSGEPDYARAS